MQNQDIGFFSSSLWREMTRRLWVVVLAGFIGAGLSVKWRSTLPETEAYEATILTQANQELMLYLISKAKNLKIIPVVQGQTVYKLNLDAPSNTVKAFEQWVSDSNVFFKQMYGDIGDMYSDMKSQLQLSVKECRSNKNKSVEIMKFCSDSEARLIQTHNDQVRSDVSIKIISLDKAVKPPTSFSKRDAIFGFFIGAFIGLIFMSLFIQFRVLRNKRS